MDKWKFEKFQGNMAIYAICPNCGFAHSPSNLKHDMTIEITHQYYYCPMCGRYLYDDSEEIDVIWNERHIFDVWGINQDDDGSEEE